MSLFAVRIRVSRLGNAFACAQDAGTCPEKLLFCRLSWLSCGNAPAQDAGSSPEKPVSNSFTLSVF